QDGKTWLRSTTFGDDKDRVLVRDDGRPTYVALDIVYHDDKLRRGFTRLINVWGADHHGTVARLKAGLAALGHDPKVLDIVLQPLTLPEELGMIKTLCRAPDVVADAAVAYEPHQVVHYLQGLIAQFHSYYTQYKKTEKVISADRDKTRARLLMCLALRTTLK